MNINRHNYEELFLLYVDHELTAAERVLVEEFVAANPDLKAELELLQQATLQADVTLDDSFKNQLLKTTEEELVNEEQLLLLLDGELRAEDAKDVQTVIQNNEAVQKEWQWLQRTKLQADASVVFPDKSILYKETQPARVFYMGATVRRWSAAAAVLLMLGTGYWLINRQGVPASDVAAGEIKTSGKSSTAANPSGTTSETNEGVTNEQTVTPQAADKVNNSSTVAQKQVKQNPVQTAKSNDNNTLAVQSKQPQVPVLQQPEINTQLQEAIVKTERKSETPGNIPDHSSVQQPETSIASVSNVSYVNYDAADDEDEQEGLLNENKQRSTGLKALLKKAKRTLERRTGIQSGESQVRFAVFAVNTQ
jgi:anti-sigma factor RsiW